MGAGLEGDSSHSRKEKPAGAKKRPTIAEGIVLVLLRGRKSWSFHVYRGNQATTECEDLTGKGKLVGERAGRGEKLCDRIIACRREKKRNMQVRRKKVRGGVLTRSVDGVPSIKREHNSAEGCII